MRRKEIDPILMEALRSTFRGLEQECSPDDPVLSGIKSSILRRIAIREAAEQEKNDRRVDELDATEEESAA